MVCPQCGTLNPDGRLACFRCEHSLSPARVAEEVRCKWHPEVPRAANCSVCGTPICEECVIEVGDVSYCPDCAAVPGEERGVAKVERVLSPLEVETYSCATFGWRLVAGVIDALIIGAGMIVLALLFWMFTGVPPGMHLRDSTNFLYWILVFLGAGWYFIGYHVSSGETPGYGASDLLLIRSDGMAVSWQAATLRYLVSILSGAFFGLGYFWMIWDPNSQTWHDKAAGTCVLRTSDRKELDGDPPVPVPPTPEDLRTD